MQHIGRSDFRWSSRRTNREVSLKQSSRSTASVLHGSDVASDGRADVFKVRERTRRRRIWRLVLILGLIDFYLWYRYLTDNPFQLPTLGPEAVIFLPIFCCSARSR